MPFDDQVEYVRKHFAHCDGFQILTEGIAPESTETANVFGRSHATDEGFRRYLTINSEYNFIEIDCIKKARWRAAFMHIPPTRGFFAGTGKEFAVKGGRDAAIEKARSLPLSETALTGFNDKPLTIFRGLIFYHADGSMDRAYRFSRMPKGLYKEAVGNKTYTDFVLTTLDRLEMDKRQATYRNRQPPFHRLEQEELGSLPHFSLFGSSVGMYYRSFTYYDVEREHLREARLFWEDGTEAGYFFGQKGCLLRTIRFEAGDNHATTDIIYEDCKPVYVTDNYTFEDIRAP